MERPEARPPDAAPAATATAVAPLLELTDVTATYGAIRALHGVTLAVPEGRIVALLGANGAGKTTTLRAISGMVKVTGSIKFAGREIAGRRPEEVSRLGLAHVPAGRGTMTQLTVAENLQMGAYTRRDRAGVKEDLARVVDYFPWIDKRRDQVAATLSGGEQQMLAIGRALMMRPRMLLLDEPSLGLAPIIVREIFDIVSRLNRDTGITVLIVEQNATLALRTATDGYVLEVGRVVLDGPSERLLQDAGIRRSYLGY